MKRWNLALLAASLPSLVGVGCLPTLDLSGLLNQDASGVVAGVAAKAESVASQIGGANGFGGAPMDGYRQHMGSMMGFQSTADLADADGQMRVEFHNDSDEECAFHLVYAASHLDLEDRMMEVTVGSGETTSIDMPCAEMIGLGSMSEVGEVACELNDGRTFDNRMCVPGFMHADYECGGSFECFFGPDTDDVDGDGDTEELIATTEALHEHLGPVGLMGHGHMMGGR